MTLPREVKVPFALSYFVNSNSIFVFIYVNISLRGIAPTSPMIGGVGVGGKQYFYTHIKKYPLKNFEN